MVVLSVVAGSSNSCGISVRVQKEDIYFHPNLEIWTRLISKGVQVKERPDGHFPPDTSSGLLFSIFAGPGSGYEYQQLHAFYLLHSAQCTLGSIDAVNELEFCKTLIT